jgi:hypothetical protein
MDKLSNFIARTNAETASLIANGQLSVDGNSFSDSGSKANAYFSALINKVGLTLFKDADNFSNPLNFVRITMPLGEYV